MKKLLVVLFVMAMSFTVTFESAFAQQDTQVKKTTGPRRQLATIVFAGLGGAVLGLSTLSFYGRPQEQLVNIAVGFAVGVIAGTAYVTFNTATTKDYYDEEGKKTGMRLSPMLIQSSQNEQAPPKIEGGGAQLTLNF